MTDRKKVINGLQCIIYGTVRCESCGYSIDKHGHHSCQQNCASDAIALLKEQEAKTGTWQWKIHGKPESGGTLGEAVCDQCGKSTYATAVKGDLNYCPNCGAKMIDRR